jgi:hypothetical protein
MWIYLKDGFYSVISSGDRSHLIVRARVKGDLERLFPGYGITRWPDRDYLYRTLVPRYAVAEQIDLAVQGIDYENFKNAVLDKRRGPFYGMVWAVMSDMQDALAKEGGGVMLPPFLQQTVQK